MVCFDPRGLRAPGSEYLSTFVLTLFAERGERHGPSVEIKHVCDASIDVLAGEPQLVQTTAKGARVWHPQSVALGSQPFDDAIG